MSLIDSQVLNTEYGSTFKREDLGSGAFRLTQHLRPIAYFKDGAYRPMSNDFVNSGDGTRPHIVTAAPMMVSSGDGTRRIHPTREADVWAEIGRPYNVATQQPYPLNAFIRNGNLLTSTNTLADIHVWHGGHFSKLGIRLKGTWRTNPPAQFAFPVALNGLTWSAGGILRKDGVPVMRLTPPVVYDFNNRLDVRPMQWEFITLNGQTYVVFTLPTDMASRPMQVPIVDPTLTLQPDGTSGKDAFIFQPAPTTNFGNRADTAIGGIIGGPESGPYRHLNEFDFSALPDAANISSSIFSLYASGRSSSNTTARTLSIYPLLVSWTETGVTWNTRNGSAAWQTAGAGGALDRGAAIGTRVFQPDEAINEFKDITLNVTTKSQLGSLGWIGAYDVEALNFFVFWTSDHTTPSQRPKVVTIYTEASGRGLFAIPFGKSFQGAFG